MRLLALIILILSHNLFAADFNLPANLSTNDIPYISRVFTSGFLTRTPMSLVGQDDFKTQVSVRVNTIDTTKVAKLGAGSKEKDLTVQEFSFSKQLPLNVELGLHSSLSLLDRDINTFGGYFRWGFQVYPWGVFSIVGHGTTASFQNVIGTNLYGGDLNLNVRFWDINVELGIGVIRSTSTFDSSVFGTSGNQPSVTFGKVYPHQFVKLSYVVDRISISGQLDMLKEVFSSANISYLF